MKEPSGSSFGSVLKFFRRREKLTQKKLADKLEVHVNSVSLWERDLERPETYGVMSNIAKILCRNEEEKRLLFEARYGTASILSLYNVPFERNPYFTGREALLQHLHDKLATRKQVVLKQAISGLGGVGKTQIALEYAYRYRDSYHDILWAKADSPETLTGEYIQLAEFLHLREKDLQDHDLIVKAIGRWLYTHEGWLLILDNVTDFSLVSRFIPPSRQGAVLLTTQNQVTEPIAQSIEIDCMMEEEGALFLLRRTHFLPLDTSFDKASPDNATTAKRLSCELGGLPLALDQAGAYILETGCSLSDYLTLYMKRRADLLQRRGTIPTDHPASVTTTFSLALERVAQKHSVAPELLSFFAFLAPDAIPEELVTIGGSHLGPVLQSVSADTFDLNSVIEALRTFSLVYRDATRKVLGVHRLIQAVLKDGMDVQTYRQWAEHAVRAVNASFPLGGFTTWSLCERLLPHTLVCAALIEEGKMKFPEAYHLLNRAGSYLYEHGRYTEAERLLQQGLDISEQCEDAEASSTFLNNLAEVYEAQGKYTEAEGLLHRSLALLSHKPSGLMDPEAVGCLTNLAKLYHKQGKYAEAMAMLRPGQVVIDLLSGVMDANHPIIAPTLNGLATIYIEQGKYTEAEALLQEVLRSSEQQNGVDHPDTATALNNLAMAYAEQGKYTEAEPLLQRALTIIERQLGPTHPHTASSLANLAVLYQQQGKYTEAESLLERALIIHEQLDPTHPSTAGCLHNLAMLYANQGKYAEAEALYQRALTIFEQKLGPMHSDIATILNGLVTLYLDQGKYAKAEPLCQRALMISEQQKGAEHPDTALSVNNLAQLYQKQGKYADAEPLYQRALAISEQQLDPMHPHIAAGLYNLASLYVEQGEYTKAEPLMKRALIIFGQRLGADHPDTARMRDSYLALRIWLQQGGQSTDSELTPSEKDLLYSEVAIYLYPTDAHIHYIRAAALFKHKHYEEALTAAEQSIDLDSDCADAYFIKAAALSELERYKEVLVTYDKIISLGPARAGIYRQKGYLLLELQRYKEALASFEQALRLDPNSALSYSDKSAVLYSLGRYEEALAAAKRAIHLDPNAADVYFGMSKILESLGKVEEAHKAYRKAKQLGADLLQ